MIVRNWTDGTGENGNGNVDVNARGERVIHRLRTHTLRNGFYLISLCVSVCCVRANKMRSLPTDTTMEADANINFVINKFCCITVSVANTVCIASEMAQVQENSNLVCHRLCPI